MVISRNTPSLRAAQTPPPPQPEKPPTQPQDTVHTGHENSAFQATLKGALQGAAFLGVPAALGAAGKMSDNPFLKGFGVGAGELYGLGHGGYLGWEATPGKKAGGIAIAVLLVPMCGIGGMLTSIGTGVIGALAGVPGAIGCAAVGAALGGYVGYTTRNGDGAF